MVGGKILWNVSELTGKEYFLGKQHKIDQRLEKTAFTPFTEHREAETYFSTSESPRNLEVVLAHIGKAWLAL
jgi:hypothetical protein